MKNLYLVTGACGHVGCNVVKKLRGRGDEVRAFALPGESAEGIAGLGVDVVRGDVRDAASLERFFADTQGCAVTVIHCAGIVSITAAFDRRVVDVNVGGTKNIIEQCISHNVRRLVYVSSVHAIPEGERGSEITEVREFSPNAVHGLYAKTKAMATQAVLEAARRGLDAVVVHPSGIIGPGDYAGGHLTQLVSDYLNGSLTACVAGGYDFVDVRDVADGIIAASDRGRAGECYILSNRFVPIKELLGRLQSITGLQKIRCVLPRRFVTLVAPLAELYYKMRRVRPLFTRYSVNTLVSNSDFSHAKATRELGYAPRDFDETLRDTVEFLRGQGKVSKKRLRLMQKRRAGASA